MRLNPPVVEDISVKGRGAGSSVFRVQFADDERLGSQLTLQPDGKRIVLHDDGTAGDENAGDKIFSAILPVDVSTIRKQQQQTLAALERSERPLVLREFHGREVTKAERVNAADIRSMLAGGVIRLVPFGLTTVDEKKTLMVTDTSVIEDPSRTFNPCTNTGTPMGKWTFGYLMQQMANEASTGINASDFTILWLKKWLHPQGVNGFTVTERPRIQEFIDRWPKLADGRIDLANAPMRLLAIVNRIDLAENLVYGNGNAGEGRFVFGVLDTSGGGCSAISFLVILEYGVPRHKCSELNAWANMWVALDALPLGSAAYNAQLETITEEFARANADPAKPNGSALNQLRTNEIALAGPWELREFKIFSTDSDAGQLREVTVKQTPDRETYNFGKPREADTAAWVNANASAIKLDRHSVPAVLPFPTLEPFLGGSSPNDGGDIWNATGIADLDARHHFSLNTCNACHGGETNTGFTHVGAAPFGSPPPLSGFLIGDGAGGDLIVTDQVSGVQHHFFDLARRAQVLNDIANQNCSFLGPIRFIPNVIIH